MTESGSDDDDDHLYEKVPEEFLSEARLNSMLHNLPEGVSVVIVYVMSYVYLEKILISW